MAIKQKSLRTPWKEGKTGMGGFITRGDGSGNESGGKTLHSSGLDGVIEVIPVYEKDTPEDIKAMQEVAENLEGYVAESGILERGKESGAGIASTSSNTANRIAGTTINGIVTRTIETQKVREVLDEFGEKWYQDKDIVGSIARLIIKNYPQFNFTEEQITSTIEEMYG